ncbi:hypothetical protein BESB_054690 [Besnoitia besnoiti]|uniref:Uncharacterized protein n=1 Tax=Besnoitia besnoiti TaxID=94643 RepID=A0A2A9MBF3_BESBE|nr:hypothetical protein BESB_054690 [Besnoitia besnoiti]PFH35818.1 hypothetical protein BESB_054690 [Besnoitia besnoiti]
MASQREVSRARRFVALLFAVVFFAKPDAAPSVADAADFTRKGSFSYEGDLLQQTVTDSYSIQMNAGDVLSVWCKNAKGTSPPKFPPEVCMAVGVNCRPDCTVSLASLLARNPKAISGESVSGDAPLKITIPDQVNLPTVFSFACVSPNNGSPTVQFNVTVSPGKKGAKMWAGTDPSAYSGATSLSLVGSFFVLAVTALRPIAWL